MESYRFMRMILFFDLPSVTKSDHREYTRFIKKIKSFGFVMLQESVYTKLALNETVVSSTMKDLNYNLPKDGIVSVLTITEKQFCSIEHLIGEIDTDVIMDDNKVVKL